MEFFRITSEMFARAFDGMNSVYSNLSNNDLLRAFENVDGRTWLTNHLKGLNVARQHVRNGAVVLRFTTDQTLVVMPVPPFEKAMQFYFRAERDHPEDDVVLVNAPDATNIRSAYRNYFSDTTEFLSYLDAAKIKLRGETKLS
jgi:putative GTP pyrophosphokinase